MEDRDGGWRTEMEDAVSRSDVEYRVELERGQEGHQLEQQGWGGRR